MRQGGGIEETKVKEKNRGVVSTSAQQPTQIFSFLKTFPDHAENSGDRVFKPHLSGCGWVFLS